MSIEHPARPKLWQRDFPYNRKDGKCPTCRTRPKLKQGYCRVCRNMHSRRRDAGYRFERNKRLGLPQGRGPGRPPTRSKFP